MTAGGASVAASTPGERYASGVTQGRWEDDLVQRAVLVELDRIHAQLVEAEDRARAARWWHLRRATAEPVRGLYLWGSVGRGKTFLVDLLYQSLPFERKLRLHFHRFMGRVHAGLARLGERADPLREVAAQFAAQARVLCLDEFFVTDIGDAMILAGLLQHLFERGTTLVTTSNIEPRQLYHDGLQRARFLPAIALLEDRCAVAELAATQDYRLRELSRAGVYFTPPDAAAESALHACFEQLAPGSRRVEPEIRVNGRRIAVRRRADGVIWFDFAALCEGPRSVADYIELAQSFNTVLISGIPRFTALNDNAARRFVNLVDEFYDRGVNLVVSAAAPILELYGGERLRSEFARTESRLIEMQSNQYLGTAHRALGVAVATLGAPKAAARDAF